MSNKFKGFTLIELLVVIAIIGILATVVIGAVNSARTKGADAGIKSNLQALRVEAELFYDEANTYGTVTSCPTSAVTSNPQNFFQRTSAFNAIQAAANTSKTAAESVNTVAKCTATASAWAAGVRLKSDTNKYWCVDSSGNSKEVTGSVNSLQTTCS